MRENTDQIKFPVLLYFTLCLHFVLARSRNQMNRSAWSNLYTQRPHLIIFTLIKIIYTPELLFKELTDLEETILLYILILYQRTLADAY